MSNVSSATLTKDFTNKLVEKFTGDGPLGKLLNSHIARTLPSSLEIDPAHLALHVQLLAYEYAIQIASEFPDKLVNSIGTTTTPKPAARAANGDITVDKPQITLPIGTKSPNGAISGDKSLEKQQTTFPNGTKPLNGTTNSDKSLDKQQPAPLPNRSVNGRQ